MIPGIQAGRRTGNIKDSPQFIENPNSSGQGSHPEYHLNPFHDTLKAAGYTYSHTVPIRRRDGSYYAHHTYRHLDHRDNVVGVSPGMWEAGKLGQARRTTGTLPGVLAVFLKNHLRRTVAKIGTGPEPGDAAYLAPGGP